jgi:small multidrug resistance family-3 protein
MLLFTYGVIPTLQSEPAFGRVYAAYGGIFVILSILWGWQVDGWLPDRFDLVGAGVALIGVAIIMWGRHWF